MKNHKKFLIIGIVVLNCIIMGYVDAVMKPEYFEKSMIKIVLFLALPVIYNLIIKDLNLKKLFLLNRKQLIIPLALGFSTFLLIIIGYYILSPFIDFSSITSSLTENIGVSKDNFVLVAIYISIINSLLEEFFFRGFAFLTLKNLTSKRFAYLFSSLAFALYHISMMIGWFPIYLLILAIIGLMVGGLIFNYLCDKSDNIYPSWMVHMFANFGINLIGFMLFGII